MRSAGRFGCRRPSTGRLELHLRAIRGRAIGRRHDRPAAIAACQASSCLTRDSATFQSELRIVRACPCAAISSRTAAGERIAVASPQLAAAPEERSGSSDGGRQDFFALVHCAASSSASARCDVHAQAERPVVAGNGVIVLAAAGGDAMPSSRSRSSSAATAAAALATACTSSRPPAARCPAGERR